MNPPLCPSPAGNYLLFHIYSMKEDTILFHKKDTRSMRTFSSKKRDILDEKRDIFSGSHSLQANS
jgi:triphosphoribosyl-dephospho-CoA synthetase